MSVNYSLIIANIREELNLLEVMLKEEENERIKDGFKKIRKDLFLTKTKR